MMQVTVLGCGPAGLLAAQGAADAGAKVTVVSKKAKSFISGAQFIHREIPSLEIGPSEVHIIKRGSAEGYAKKVYGDPEHPTSWGNYEHGEILYAWPMHDVYERLWDRWEPYIVDSPIDKGRLDWIEMGQSDMLISSIPAQLLCANNEHNFLYNEVSIVSGKCPSTRNSIIYNGDGRQRWFRSSFLFGYTGTEYSLKHSRPGKMLPGGAAVLKPQATNCDCRPQWRRVGRYGKWTRDVLAHSAYFEVNDALLGV